MKKVLASIVAASFLTLGAMGTGNCCCDEQKESQQYLECIKKYEKLVPGKDYKTGTIILGFDKGTTEQEAKQFIERNNLEMKSYYDFINTAFVKVPEGEEIKYICQFQSIVDKTIVEFAEPNHIYRLLKGKDEIVKGKILICFDKGTTEEQANSFIENYDSNDELEMILYREGLRFAEVKVPEGKEEHYAHYFNNMRKETIVQFAEPDYIYTIQQSE